MTAGPPAMSAGLRVLVVDDELPARNELAYLLGNDERITTVATAQDGAEALRALEEEPVDAVFLDIHMPGLDGLDLARVLRRFAAPPAIVFVTAYDDHAVAAFDLRAVDYLLKPVRTQRLRESVDRILQSRGTPAAPPVAPAAAPSAAPSAAAPAPSPPAAAPHGTPDPPAAADGDETIAVELGGVTRFVRRSDVRYVEAHGDYARLVTADGRHLVRVPLAVLEERWAAAGFVRIHRRWLVRIDAIEEVRFDAGRMTVLVGGAVLEVSRRHTRELRDRLVRAARPGRGTGATPEPGPGASHGASGPR